ncbi:MAG: stage III sporulation protein AC [Clostridia bacterium]|nr:stage III sporulation protein AC [Clostridia bacterium]
MDVGLIFKIAAIGIVVAIIYRLLVQSGRDEQALMVTIAGLIVVMIMIVYQIHDLFTTIQTLFEL